MSRIVVTVSGFANTGKSTIASIIVDALAKHDIRSLYINPEGEPKLPNEVLTAVRLEALKDKGLQVIVDEKQTHRMSIKDE